MRSLRWRPHLCVFASPSRARRGFVVGLTIGMLGPCSILAQQTRVGSHVPNSGVDEILPWKTIVEHRIGESLDDPTTFFQVFPWTIATDAHGHVYVLDVGDYRVVVIDSTGRHIRDLGAQGGGPGELLRPVGLSVDAAGVVTVADQGKMALVRFDSTGKPIEQVPLKGRFAGVGNVHEGLLLAQGPSPLTQTKLSLMVGAETRVLAEVEDQNKMVAFHGCGASVPGRPFFAVTVRWGAAGTSVAVSDGPDYRLTVWHGIQPSLIVTRDIPAITVTRAEALRSRPVRYGYQVRWPGGVCKVTPDELLDAMGYADRLSPIDRIVVAPDGSIWVRRATTLKGDWKVDVFDPNGYYTGTLPDHSAFPAAFISMSRFATQEFTRDGAPILVLYRIERPSPG